MPALDLQTLLAENARLREELAATRAELVGTREELGRLREETAAGHARITELTAEVGRLTEQVARSNDRITELAAAANRNRRKPAPAPKPPLPPAPPPEGAAAEAFENRPRPPVLPDKPKPDPKPHRPTGRKPLPEHLPADESESWPEGPCECGCCDFDTVDEVVEVKLDVVREHQRRRVVRRKTRRCRKCGKRRTGPAPAAPFPRSKVTCAWLAWLVVQKFYLLVPLDRIRRHLALSGVPLAISFLVSQIARAADLLEVVDGEHWRDLRSGPWMQSDGTSLKVIVPELEGTHSGHLEVYLREETVVFQYEPEKGAETVATKLMGFKGLLQVDAEHRYNQLFETGQCTEVGCNAHGVRKYEAAEAVQPILAAEGHAFLSAVFAFNNEATAAGLTGDELRSSRQKRILPVFDDMKKWMDAVEPTLVPGDPLATAIRYYRNHWGALTRFIDHPEVGPDNSAAEREFQTVAKARLNWLFAGSTEGAHRAAVLLGVVATCRNLGVDIQAYLTWAFERLGTHRGRYNLPAARLTPAAYARELRSPGPPEANSS